MNSLPDYFGAPKVIIAGVHFLPLPGSPNYDHSGGMRAIVARAKGDVKPLVDNGVQAILFANEADIPYLQKLGPDTVAAHCTPPMVELLKPSKSSKACSIRLVGGAEMLRVLCSK